MPQSFDSHPTPEYDEKAPYRQSFNASVLDLTHEGAIQTSQVSTAIDSIEESWSYGTRDSLDTLPKTWTRGLLYLLIVFSSVVVPWAMFSKVDETGTARGRLEPKGRTDRLDAPVSGTISKVSVKEGETVQAGQVLMELESETARSELQQAESRLDAQQNRLSQLELTKPQLETTMRTQQLQSKAQLTGQLVQINQIQQQIRDTQEQSDLTAQLLVKDRNRAERFRHFQKDGIISGIQVEDAERSMLETQQRHKKAQAEISQAQSELQKQQSNFAKGLREGELIILESKQRLRDLQGQIATTRSEIAQTQNQIETLKFQLQQRVVRSPISGTVFQLSVKNPGSVVQAGASVAEIAPQKTPFVLRAQIPSQHSGFLSNGMPVKLKFDAYPFQDYGVVSGNVRSISPDSKVKETREGTVEVFELEIALAQPYLEMGDRKIVLTPGQAATAEVIVRQRQVIDYVLDPFKKLQTGGLKL